MKFDKTDVMISTPRLPMRYEARAKTPARPALRPARFWGQLGTKFFRLSSHRQWFGLKLAKSKKRRFVNVYAVKTHFLQSDAKASQWIQLPPPPPYFMVDELIVTDRIIGLLEQGVVPWQKPWRGGEMLPRNLVSKREYRSVNVFLLQAVMYESPFWLTFNQAKELGGHVKKGEHACPVAFWKWLEVAAQDQPTGKKTVPFLRYYSVFNAAQCEDIPKDKIPVLNSDKREHSPIVEAEQKAADFILGKQAPEMESTE